MSFDEYILACFADIDDCGKSDAEKIEIITKYIDVAGSIEEEKKKYAEYVTAGNDMQTVVNMFKGTIAKMLNMVGVEDFNDLKHLPELLKRM